MLKGLLILLFPAALFAQGASTGVAHLKLPYTARNAAMGEALVAEPGHLSSYGLNPANLLKIEELGILISHTKWIQDIQSEYFAISYPAEFGTIAFAISSANMGDIEIRDRPGPALATFTPRATTLQASYATTIMEKLGLGISAKFLYEKLYIEEATGFALDVGVIYPLPVEGLTLGASIANIGEVSAFVRDETELPLTARLGASYKASYEDFTFILGSQFVSEKRSLTSRIQMGAEAKYQEIFAVRVGYLTGLDTRSISGGFGVNYDWLYFDYGYVPFSHGLGTAHLFTLGFRL